MHTTFAHIEQALSEGLVGIDGQKRALIISHAITSVRELVLRCLIRELHPGDMYQYLLHDSSPSQRPDSMYSVIAKMKRQTYLIVTFRSPLSNHYRQLLEESYKGIIAVHLPFCEAQMQVSKIFEIL